MMHGQRNIKSSIVFLLTELFNICRFKQVSLSAAFTFFVSTTPSFQFVSKIVLEMELGEALNDKEIYLKNDRGTQIVSVATSLVSPTLLEPDSHISPGANGVFARCLYATLSTIITLLYLMY